MTGVGIASSSFLLYTIKLHAAGADIGPVFGGILVWGFEYLSSFTEARAFGLKSEGKQSRFISARQHKVHEQRQVQLVQGL